MSGSTTTRPGFKPFDTKRLLNRRYQSMAGARLHTLLKEDGWDVRLVEKIEWHGVWRVRLRTETPTTRHQQRSVKSRIKRLLMTQGIKGGTNINMAFEGKLIKIAFQWANGIPGAFDSNGNPVRMIHYPQPED